MRPESLLLVLCCLLSVSVLSQGHPEFQKRIPNGANVLDGRWPGVGHMSPAGGDARNPFGLDFKAAGFKWTVDLCQKDSDNDTLTNGEELGDPQCVWKPGDIPARTHHITHPGFAIPPGMTPETCDHYHPGPDISVFNMTFNKFQIPAKQTTYACQRFDLPQALTDEKHHIVRFDPIVVQTDIVHHLIVFSCTDRPVSADPWECGLEMPQGCKEFVWGWARGGLPECLPEQAGIPVGADGPKFFVIQMHYNNDGKVEGAIDSSGVSMQLTPHLKKYDASVFDNGASESDIVIPPHQSAFQVISDCPAFCTDAALPDEGIYVYAYLMHMHLLGSKMWTELIYANGSSTMLGIVPSYDFNSQTWVPVKPYLKLSKGDRLITHCQYDSTGRENVTLGGASTTDEMCTANIAYFPRLPGFDLCTNFTDDDGVHMGRCGTFDFNWDTHEKFPICDLEDVIPQAALIASTVLPNCTKSQSCSGLCRQSLLDWASESTCVKRNDLNTTLTHCGIHQADCDKFTELFNQPCLKLCYSDKPAIGAQQCGSGKMCVDFVCKDVNNNKIVAITAAVTLISTLLLIVIGIFVLTKCHRVRRRVEYVN